MICFVGIMWVANNVRNASFHHGALIHCEIHIFTFTFHCHKEADSTNTCVHYKLSITKKIPKPCESLGKEDGGFPVPPVEEAVAERGALRGADSLAATAAPPPGTQIEIHPEDAVAVPGPETSVCVCGARWRS